MAFKLEPPYDIDNTPIYTRKDEKDTLGRATNAGTIIVNSELKDPKLMKKVCDHEKIHLDQIARGDLDYDNDYVYWKGKRYSRAQMEEGAKSLPWENEAWEGETNNLT